MLSAQLALQLEIFLPCPRAISPHPFPSISPLSIFKRPMLTPIARSTQEFQWHLSAVDSSLCRTLEDSLSVGSQGLGQLRA